MAKLSEEQKNKLMKGLKKHFKSDVITGKGGFFVKGHGYISLTKARQITGIKADKRNIRPKTGGYGDYAIIRKIAGKM